MDLLLRLIRWLYTFKWSTATDINTDAIKNITSNPGIMPLELGDAKLQRTTHTLVHYYSTEILSHEFSILNSQYIAFLSNVSIDHAAMPTVEPQLKNINFTIATIKEKLAFTKPSTAAIHTHKNKTKTRSRRGLLNVLGSGIKLVTGNLDDSDGQRYETF
ncbi:unnamed protein product [Bemisia tabaci]|uniref:Uncharacterized protein n=1 Tax=Bemisia tabaci TaxID=7038 RepID=A0A9P0A5R5_BEMTA|nr:unnamed protein product [Bemisia tabaci]